MLAILSRRSEFVGLAQYVEAKYLRVETVRICSRSYVGAIFEFSVNVAFDDAVNDQRIDQRAVAGYANDNVSPLAARRNIGEAGRGPGRGGL